jgi:membrane-bound lytic murein transglycosylase D
VLLAGAGATPVFGAVAPEAITVSPGSTTPEAAANSILARAEAHLETALEKYDLGDFPAAELSTQAAARLLYGTDLTGQNKRFATATSKLSLITVRLNRLLHEVSPDLEPERFSMPIPYNPRIEREIDNILTVSREEFARWLRRSGRYLSKLRKCFSQEGLPEDLVYVALVESGFNPRNRSHKEAVGLFQFLASTGELVGLKKDLWVDERRDPDKATTAAIRHLKSLFQEFGDWELALAAYNAGSSRVWQAIRSQGVRDYWQLMLPAETEAYVPKFYAALVISREPDVFGFSPVRESLENYAEVPIPGAVDLQVIADCCGVTVNAIMDLNNELTKGCTPPGTEPYLLRVPVGTAAKFQAAFAALPDKQKYLTSEEIARRKFREVYEVHTVRSGENLYTIARKYHTSVTKITQWNPGTRGKKYIHPGQKLRIYRIA